MTIKKNEDVVFPNFRPLPGQPAFYDEQRKFWFVFRYAEVQRVLSDYNTFTSERGRLDPSQKNNPKRPGDASLISMDPPRHRLYRTLVTQAFTPRTIAQLESRIVTIVHRLRDHHVWLPKIPLLMGGRSRQVNG